MDSSSLNTYRSDQKKTSTHIYIALILDKSVINSGRGGRVDAKSSRTRETKAPTFVDKAWDILSRLLRPLTISIFTWWLKKETTLTSHQPPPPARP
jgi:hypothetical protein